MQILFATFDPPDPLVPGNVGHFCVVALNLKLECFQFLDSMRGQMIQMFRGFFFAFVVCFFLIPWCELRLRNINEKFYHLLSAHFILVCNLSYMISLVD
jgi:hypothetical protein